MAARLRVLEYPDGTADQRRIAADRECRIGLNETQLGSRHSVQFFRLYKPDGAERWQNTTSFNRDDLPLVAKLADMAMLYIYGAQQSEGI